MGGNGELSGFSKTVSVIMKALPGGKTVANYKASPSNESTTYKADVLVPYGFVRLYIWDKVGCDWDSNPGWPVNFLIEQFVCTHYMVEGPTLYKYSGTKPAGTTNAPWSWTSLGSVDVSVDGYTYKWTLPIGTSTTDTSRFMVQAQGYGPFINVFEPDPNVPETPPETPDDPGRGQQDPNDSSPEDFDCKGSSMCSSSGMLKQCDHAVNDLLIRNDDLNYANFGNRETGTCYGQQLDGGGCGIFIQKGDNCEISGNDMWWAYQNIREKGGCGVCGSWHRRDGCLVTINYVTGCANRGF